MWKPYRKTATQEMRPYVPGEDLAGISVSNEDTPEDGGMIARNAKNPDDQWYVAKAFFDDNYEEADKAAQTAAQRPEPYQDRVLAEKAELDIRLGKLRTYIEYAAAFASLPLVEQRRLRRQEAIMALYSDVLDERIQAFE